MPTLPTVYYKVVASCVDSSLSQYGDRIILAVVPDQDNAKAIAKLMRRKYKAPTWQVHCFADFRDIVLQAI